MVQQRETARGPVVQIELPVGAVGVHVLFDAPPTAAQASRQNTIDTLRSAISEK